VRRGTADLDIGSVRFEHPRHRILATPVVIIVVIVPVAHPLIVLTVSHVLPLFIPALKFPALRLTPRCRYRCCSARCMSHHGHNGSAGRFHINFAIRHGQQRRVPPRPGMRCRLPQIIPPAKTSKALLREHSSAITGFRSLCGQVQRKLSIAIALR